MKYGYMYYQKPLKKYMKTRPVNLGDPIQSLAVKNIYKEMGISDNDIIPVPRYDLADYDGEECICLINGASNYEELAYDSHFMPPSTKIHGIPFSLHIHRALSEEELQYYKNCGGVGCRDYSTVEYLKGHGVDAYLSGCITLTLPRRDKESSDKADKVYLIDAPSDVVKIMPEELKKVGIKLSSVVRYENPGISNRMSVDAANEEHKRGEERVALLRDTARLVVTSKLHVAAPCVAMGIPVVLAKNYYGDRFGFLDRIIPTYSPENYAHINWNPTPVDFEEDKKIIKEMAFESIKKWERRLMLNDMWNKRKPIYKIDYSTATSHAVELIPFPSERFYYAVWGVVLSAAFYLEEAMKENVPQAKLIAGIDIAADGEYCGTKIIKPDEINSLPENTIIIIAAPSAQEQARKMLMNGKRPFVLLHGTKAECYNFRSYSRLRHSLM